jgi:hypothetical protein
LKIDKGRPNSRKAVKGSTNGWKIDIGIAEVRIKTVASLANPTIAEARKRSNKFQEGRRKGARKSEQKAEMGFAAV